jgi:hypothetical protein
MFKYHQVKHKDTYYAINKCHQGDVELSQVLVAMPDGYLKECSTELLIPGFILDKRYELKPILHICQVDKPACLDLLEFPKSFKYSLLGVSQSIFSLTLLYNNALTPIIINNVDVGTPGTLFMAGGAFFGGIFTDILEYLSQDKIKENCDKLFVKYNYEVKYAHEGRGNDKTTSIKISYQHAKLQCDHLFNLEFIYHLNDKQSNQLTPSNDTLSKLSASHNSCTNDINELVGKCHEYYGDDVINNHTDKIPPFCNPSAEEVFEYFVNTFYYPDHEWKFVADVANEYSKEAIEKIGNIAYPNEDL